MKHFPFAILVGFAAPAFSGTLPSGLDDPLASAATCEAFANVVADGGDANLQAIAYAEGRTAHHIHTDVAKSATDLLFARANGVLSMLDEAVAVYVNSVCRSL